MRLAEIAHARSGDKGDRSDIGLFAYDAAGYARIERAITPDRLREHFAWLGVTAVRVWPLPNLLALKIVLEGALAGNAARNLRSDNLGKTVAAALLRMEL